MSSEIQVLHFCQTTEVRMVMQNGEPWWVLVDVCKVLELKEPHRVAARLDEDERTLSTVIDGMGRGQETTIINESGLYSVILRSDKPQAKAFKRWVTHEVLPSIRRTGRYSVGARLGDEKGVSQIYAPGGPRLRKTARLLLYTLRQIAVGGEVQITNLRLMEMMNVGSEQTIRAARFPFDAGYIEYAPGIKGKPGVYKLVQSEDLVKALP